MSFDNKAFVTEFVDNVLVKKDLNQIEKYISSDFVNHSKNALPGIHRCAQVF